MSGKDVVREKRISKGKASAIPLTQVQPLEADEDTVEAIDDWHYWKMQGHLS